MEIWYHATYGIIERVEVVKSTEKMLTLKNGRRVSKVSQCSYYAQSRASAKTMLVEYYQDILDQAQNRLDNAELNLNAVKALI